VRRFAYVLDPICLVGCALYATNRWLIKPHTHIAFFHNWFNDALLIPCALPPLLLSYRWLGLRPAEAMPTVAEIWWTLAGWSVLFEVIGPHIMRTTGDPWDVVAYFCGAAVATFWWRREGETRCTFDGLAPYYRWMERVLAGQKLQQCRTAFLRSIPEPRRALLVGEGNGRFLVELLRAYPKTRCWCVDSSAGMLARARGAVEAAGLSAAAVEFFQADILEWKPPGEEIDLIASHFVLDCFRPEQLDAMLEKLAGASAPGALWLVSDFQEPPSGLARWRARAILSAMYLFFRSAVGLPAGRLTPPDGILVRNGFALRERRVFEWGLLHSDVWERK